MRRWLDDALVKVVESLDYRDVDLVGVAKTLG